MAALQPMPPLAISQPELKAWGDIWLGVQGSVRVDGVTRVKRPNRFDRKQSMDFGLTFDRAFGRAVAIMLGNIEMRIEHNERLTPAGVDCVEVGKTRIVGGIRPQNFDMAYRPDGPRIVFDSKTLNDSKSISKNWQNMINDLASEAATVHTRFPYCVVAFIVALPRPALAASQQRDLVRTLQRLGSRKDELDQHHLAEAISLAVWDPDTGLIDHDILLADSNLRIDTMHERIYPHYIDRYQNLPPHDV